MYVAAFSDHAVALMEQTPDAPLPVPPSDGTGPIPAPAAAPATAAIRPGFRIGKWAIAGGVAIVALGAAGALAASLFLKSGPGIDKMVPDNAGWYATVYLDPSLPQKANLFRMAHHFPDLQTDADITAKLNHAMDDALKSSGLSFTKDIQPWLGTRISTVGDISSKPTGAFLFDSRDDSAAQATLAKIRTTTEGKTLTWTQDTYQGVTLSVGTHQGSTTVYAFFDHTAVVGTSEGILRDIIDTDQGKRGNLLQTANYQATVALLPSDRLVLAYVNGPALVSTLKSEATNQLKDAMSGLQVPDKTWKELAAFQGIGLTLAAGSDGLTGDLEIKYDASKLDAATRDALAQSSRRNALLAWIPQRTFAALASNGIKSSLQSALDQTTIDASTRQSLQQFGLLGQNGVIAHLTGDLALEVESPAAGSIEGAIMIGTNDAPGMKVFLTKLATLAEYSGSTQGFGGVAPAKQTTYRGVAITSFPIDGLGVPGIEPSIAVTGGVAFVATSPSEIKRLIDAHASGLTIATAEHFAAVRSATFADPQNFFYVDVTATTNAILGYVPPDQRANYEKQIAPNLSPVKAVMIASQSQSDRLSERVFVLIPQ